MQCSSKTLGLDSPCLDQVSQMPWDSYMISLCLSFLALKVGRIVPCSRGY